MASSETAYGAVNNINSSAVEGAFSSHAIQMRRAGFAVLPSDGKSPRMSGFNNWTQAPGPAAVEKWAAAHRGADLVYVPGLSRTKRGGDPIIVVDGDDLDAADQVVSIFGDTPGRVKTRRGRHFLYRDAEDQPLPKVSSLKKFGLNADLKHGRSIVVAPPSTHEKERSFEYSWDGCDETVIRDLPAFNRKALEALLERRSKMLRNASTLPPAAPQTHRHSELRCESRKLGLNDELVSMAAKGLLPDTENALRFARSWNEGLRSRGLEPMEASEVVEVVSRVMADIREGKIVPTVGHRAICISDADEIRQMVAAGPNGAEAFSFLQLLRAEHGARCARGETFVLVADAMVRDRVMGSWSARKYRDMREFLLDTCKIEQVTTAKNKVAATFRLLDRELTPCREQSAPSTCN